MSLEPTAEETPTREKVVRQHGLSEQLRDFDFGYIAHPAVSVSYLLITPIVMMAVAGFSIEELWWELIFASMVTVPVFVLFRRPRLSLTTKHLMIRMVTIGMLITVSQILARVLSPDHILFADTGSKAPGPEEAVLAAAIVTYSVQDIFIWLLLMVLASGSLNYRHAKKSQKKLAADIQQAKDSALREADLAKKQRESVGEISRRVDAIEKALSEQTGSQVNELTAAVRGLRQEVVRPSLEQLNALVAQARSAPQISQSVTATVAGVPWRWQGVFFSGTVGALLIATSGLLLIAAQAYYQLGNLIQLVFVAFAFFVSVPASLILFFAAALTPIIDPNQDVFGGVGLIALIAVLGGISFLQRLNRVRQVRAVEAMSVAGAQLALDQVRRAQDLKVIEDRVNSVLHGSVQSTLLALELGLQSGDESVTKHSADALSHLRKAVARLDEPTSAPSEDFEKTIENIVSVWAGSLRVTVDQSPDAADALHNDPLAASAVIEVVKEGTQNAVKHSDTRDVRVVIGLEGSLIRVRVSHQSSGQPVTIRSAGLGMRYLGAITRTLRLVDDGVTTTLYAEIPTSSSVPA
jgi:signal transduction histidine kinase